MPKVCWTGKREQPGKGWYAASALQQLRCNLMNLCRAQPLWEATWVIHKNALELMVSREIAD
jgi:hypothetical protein